MLADVLPNAGVSAVIDGKCIALFRVEARSVTSIEETDRACLPTRWFAIDDMDPHSQVAVLSRGIIGSVGERVVVASPLYKHHFDLHTGECLERPQDSVRTYPVRFDGERVWVGLQQDHAQLSEEVAA